MQALTLAKRNRGRGRWYLLLLPLFFAVSCSDRTLSLFFDIPPPSEKPAPAPKAKAPAAAPAAAAASPAADVVEAEGGPPDFEKIFDWEQAAELLPKDDIDEVDWMEALRQDIIKPRAEITRYGNPSAKVFKFDFFFAGPDPETDAYFPHSAHTQWLTCESCHTAIFPYRELGLDGSDRFRISMDQIFEGQYCGKCHGVVAFALDSCNRCHLSM